MRHVKKITALLLAAVMAVSAAACSSSDNKWSMKTDKDTLAIGVYIYFLYTGYQSASYYVEDTSKPVLEQKIEDKDAAQWIKDFAMDNCKKLLAIDSKLSELGAELSAEELSEAKSGVDSYWSMYSTIFEGYGISKDSFAEANTVASAKSQKLFTALYGKGGAEEVSDSDIQKYYEENYTDYNYIMKSLTTTDEDGNSEDMTDAEIKEVEEQMEGYQKLLEEGKTMQDVADQFKEDDDREADPLNAGPANLENSSFNDAVKDALKEMKPGESRVVTVKDSTNACYLLYKKDIADSSSDMLKDEEQRTSILSSMKSEDYSDYLDKAAEEISVTINDGAVNKYQPDMFYVPSSSSENASSDASSAESPSSEDSSSDASSEDSSSEETSSETSSAS